MEVGSDIGEVEETMNSCAKGKLEKKPELVTDSLNTLKSYVLEVSTESDVVEILSNCAGKRGSVVWVHSATGTVTNVSLRHLDSPVGTVVTLRGRFDIQSLAGSVLPTPGESVLKISLLNRKGQVAGGLVEGPLIAAGPVFVLATLSDFSPLNSVRWNRSDESALHQLPYLTGDEMVRSCLGETFPFKALPLGMEGDPYHAQSSSSSIGLFIGNSRKIGKLEKELFFEKELTPNDVGDLNLPVIPKEHVEKYLQLGPSSKKTGGILKLEDNNGKQWRFRYSYWKDIESFVLNKGWSRFVREMRLLTGDIVSCHRGIGELNYGKLYINCKRKQNAPDPIADSALVVASAKVVAPCRRVPKKNSCVVHTSIPSMHPSNFRSMVEEFTKMPTLPSSIPRLFR